MKTQEKFSIDRSVNRARCIYLKNKLMVMIFISWRMSKNSVQTKNL